jgi:hypothetical protein
MFFYVLTRENLLVGLQIFFLWLKSKFLLPYKNVTKVRIIFDIIKYLSILEQIDIKTMQIKTFLAFLACGWIIFCIFAGRIVK